MSELKTYLLTCPGCGAGLRVGQTVETFACLYCGASVRVERGDGIVSLCLITDALSKVQRGTDRTAAELALLRIPQEIDAQRAELDSTDQRIHTLEHEIHVASTPPTASRESALVLNHTLKAIGVGGLFGLVSGWLLNFLLPTSFSVFAGFILALGHVVQYYKNPFRSLDRTVAAMADNSDSGMRLSSSWNVEELEKLQRKRQALSERLQGLSQKLAEARAIVEA